MTKDEYRMLKSLVMEVEIKCLVHGGALQSKDFEEDPKRIEVRDRMVTRTWEDWGQASDKLYEYMDKLLGDNI